jgi:hypothetical protein
MTVRARCLGIVGSVGPKNTTNGLGNKTWTELEKYCSSIKMETLNGMSNHLNRRRKVYEKQMLRGKSALHEGAET